MRTLALLCLVATAACGSDVFECQTDEQCQHDGAQGRCELAGLCSFPDPGCQPLTRRFGDLAGAYAGQCVTGTETTPEGLSVAAFGETGDATYPNTTFNTWIDSSSPTTSNAGSDMIRADAEPLRYGLLRFDLSALPASAAVSAAELHVWTDDNGALPQGTTEVYCLHEQWTEDAGWDARGNGMSWSTPGAGPPARDAAPFITFAPHAATHEYVLPLPVDMVSGWLRDPSTNAGVLFINNQDANGDSVRLASRTNSSMGRRPLFVIRYR
jgi:hypothetical protein